MSADQTDQIITQPEPIATPQTLQLYANYTSLTATPEEFILRFCLRDLNDPTKATELARVFVTLPHAKRLVSAIARSIKAYEEIFGDVPVDPIQHLTPAGRIKLGVEDSKVK